MAQSKQSGQFSDDKSISGKKLVPIVLIGFVLVTIIGFYGTYFVAQTITPMSAETQARLRERAEQQVREHGDKGRNY